MTRTMPMIPLTLALDDALASSGCFQWDGTNDSQMNFLNLLPPYAPAADFYKQLVSEITAHTTPEGSNKPFACSYKAEMLSRDSIRVTGTEDARFKWLAAGAESTISDARTTYPAFDLCVVSGAVCVHKPDRQGYIVQLLTDDNMVVRLQLCDDPGSGVALAEAALNLHAANLMRISSQWHINRVRIPKVCLNTAADLNWLRGLYTASAGAFVAHVAETVGHSKIAVSHHGKYPWEEAVKSVDPEATDILEVNSPFLLTYGHAGFPPFLSAYVTQQDWSDPDN